MKRYVTYDPYPYIKPHAPSPTYAIDDYDNEVYEGEEYFELPDGTEIITEAVGDISEFIEKHMPDYVFTISLPDGCCAYGGAGEKIVNGDRCVSVNGEICLLSTLDLPLDEAFPEDVARYTFVCDNVD